MALKCIGTNIDTKLSKEVKMTLSNNKLKIQDVVFILGIWFSAFAGLLNTTINKIALYIVLPILFCVTILTNIRVKPHKYMRLLLLLFIWILFSVLWASNVQLALVQVNQILGSFILCYIISIQGLKPRLVPWLYVTFIILLIADWYYAYNNIFSVIDLGVERLNDDKLNANTFGYHTFYATFALFILGEINMKHRRLFQIMFLLMIPLSFLTAIYTASRQILLIQVPLILLLLYGRYYRSKSIRLKVVAIIITVISALVLIPRAVDMYSGSTLKERTELDVNEDGRLLLLLDAISVGNQYFPLGVGANNFQLYTNNKGFSHNTYLELYANEGIIGVLLYVIMLLTFLKRQWRRYRMTGDVIFFYFFVAGFIYALDGFFYVFYPHLWLISFFILIATHSELYYNKYKH